MLINLQEIKDFVSISAVADYLGLEKEYGKRKFPGERTASIELYPNTQTFYDFGRAVGGDMVLCQDLVQVKMRKFSPF